MFKNAVLSIKKNMGKSILLFLLMAFIANLIIAGLSIHSASTKSMQTVRSSLGNDVTLSVNMQNMMANREKGEAIQDSMPTITTTMADQLKSLKYVDSYNYQMDLGVNSDTLTPVEVESNQMPKMNMNQTETTTTSFNLSGNTSMSQLSNFQNETYTLKEGRLLTSDDASSNVAVISSTLASDNDLSIGDTITFTVNETNQSFEIVGIFDVVSDQGMRGMGMNRSNPYNTIYVDYETVKDMNENSDELTSATFYLDDPKHADAFKTLAKKQTDIDFDTYTLDANDQLYQRNVASLENIESFATIFLIVVMVAGSMILCLILMLSIRSRFYEIGINMSMGQSKLKIIMQLFLETILIASLAFVLSLGTGKMASSAIGNMLVSSTSNQPSETIDRGMMQAPNRDQIGKENQPMEAMNQTSINTQDVSLTLMNVIELAGMTILICILAVLLPALYILRLSPREILIRKEN